MSSRIIADSPEYAAAASGVVPGELSMLPRSRAARVAVWLVIAGLSALTFAAWLRPNMVFDLANMVFCL